MKRWILTLLALAALVQFAFALDKGEAVYQELRCGTCHAKTGEFQKSWTYQKFSPNEHFTWRDHIEAPGAGTYHFWMRICFTDGVCTNLLGPVKVKVQ